MVTIYTIIGMSCTLIGGGLWLRLIYNAYQEDKFANTVYRKAKYTKDNEKTDPSPVGDGGQIFGEK